MVVAAAVRWARDAVGPSAHLEAELDGDEQVTLVVQASLGALSTEWSQEVTETGTVAVSIAPPEAAFLDPLAEDYVTGLSAKLVARDASGRVHDDGSLDTSFLAPYACIGDPWAGNPDPVDDKDWLEDLINADDDDTDGVQCTGTPDNRSTSYDWGRYWWAMRTIEQVPELDLWGMWDEANAYGWRTTDTGAAPLPVDAMETAATLSGLTTEHDNQNDHGLDH